MLFYYLKVPTRSGCQTYTFELNGALKWGTGWNYSAYNSSLNKARFIHYLTQLHNDVLLHKTATTLKSSRFQFGIDWSFNP